MLYYARDERTESRKDGEYNMEQTGYVGKEDKQNQKESKMITKTLIEKYNYHKDIQYAFNVVIAMEFSFI